MLKKRVWACRHSGIRRRAVAAAGAVALVSPQPQTVRLIWFAVMEEHA